MQLNSKLNKKILVLASLVLLTLTLFLFYKIDLNHFDYAIANRIPKIIAIMLGGSCIAFTTIIFQTITNNQILTPSILGLDSMYVLIQTFIVFMFGSTNLLIVNKQFNFFVNLILMIFLSILLYKVLFEKITTYTLFY